MTDVPVGFSHWETNHLISPASLLHRAIKCKCATLIPTHYQSHQTTPIIDGRAMFKWFCSSGGFKVEMLGVTTGDKAQFGKGISSSRRLLSHCMSICLCSDVGITSLTTPRAACLCSSVCMWVRWLFAEALSVSSTKSYSVPGEMQQRDNLLQQRHLWPGGCVGCRCGQRPSRVLALKPQTAIQNYNLRSSKPWCPWGLYNKM